MEEASSDTPKKRRPEDLLDQDLQHPASKSKRSLETKRSEEEGKSSNEICGQDLLQEGKILEPKLVDDEEEVKGNIKSQTIEIEEEEGDGGGVDLISSLPNDALNTIVSKLNTKEGARTQILAKRWKPIWYSSPLNLQVDDGLATQERRRISIVDKILSNHTGGGRRLYLHNVRIRSLYDKFDSWFESPALNNLEELDFCYSLLSGSPVLESLLILDCNGLRKISEPRINVADTQYDNLPAAGSIHCLGQHLNKIVIRGYQGRQADIDFANFFLVNARVLRVMKIVAPRMISEKWMANQRKSLLLDYKASKDAEIHFTYCYLRTEMDCGKRTHDLSVSDPFDM
ncbi:hypothetical protein PR202_gb27500 [Eleusine coracana subsp. coracana]|uniref:FBD domain-containing protein n=1 Tax=Eleusine coracana subsp. coracana TaxID=191504 RepID=A0AAV5FW81_ELECO|nr:hypothetical protein PR202_gb27500 [Eleusine coracana subsp. coracana]